ncbi:SUKH-4 family immunity protein [Streptomyces sp. NPDC093589]|uniref:SUKH-4 family immunity protein n=1 Tax=Streptomyces sp. NPDC093589 TaxID=3366043 RepID=UPI0037F6F2D4
MPAQDNQPWSQVQEWLELPVRKRQRLAVNGERGSGKSAFLQEIADRTPGATFVDCSGLTAEEVALRTWEAAGAGLERDDLMRGRTALRESLSGDHVILLANPQWAGRTFTSSVPLLITRALSFLISWAPGANIRLALEWDSDRLGPPRPGDRVVSPPGPGAADSPGHSAGHDTWHPLGALAAAELPEVPESVYRLLHEALEGPPDVPEGAVLGAEYADVLDVRSDAEEGLLLSFRSRSLMQRWRQAHPLGQEAQRRIVQALVTAGPEPLSRYARHALPAHAALGGVFEDVLLQGRVLAQLHPQSVWDALACAFPQGVPQEGRHGGLLAEIRALEARGAWSLTQGEWVSWLHHSAVGAGLTEFSRELTESGVRMPWRTVWSRWRTSGVFGPVDGEVGRVDEIALIPASSSSAPSGKLGLLTARDATTAKSADPDHAYVRQEWDPATGERLAEPAVVAEPLNEADWVFGDRIPKGLPAAFAEQFDGEWDVAEGGDESTTPLPRSPVSVTQAIESDRTWVLAGEGGLFAVSCVAEVGGDEPPAWREEPLIAPHAKVAAPELPAPAAAAAQGAPESRAWLEETFGAGACRRHPESELPDGVTDVRARRFLAEVGLPDVGGFLHLQTNGGLTPVDGGPTGGGEGGAARYALGSWMHADLLLDGTTGQVLRSVPDEEPVLAGESLPQFFTMVRLFDAFRRAFCPSRADRRDAQHVLAAWCARIDPEAADGETWEEVLGGTEFEDGTWDLVSRNGRPPL